MSVVEFELPDELQSGVSYEEILQKMLSSLPPNFDKIEGGWLWDMTAPSALEAAELLEFWLPLALMTNFHMWATGEWLDYHAHDCGLERRPATYSYGDVVVETTNAVTFPKGFVFSVPSENDSPAIGFETLEEHALTSAGTYTIRVKAVEAGTNSNVPADTITIMKNPIKPVVNITNPDDFTGGVEAESDDSLRQRIDDFYAGRGASFVGNKRDYERWSKEVPGVGYAHCIPIYAGPNTVKIVISDANGDPANQEIIDAVALYIFGTGHTDINRLAPIGIVQYEVAPPTLQDIAISCKAKIADGKTPEEIKKKIATALKKYFRTLADEDNTFGELLYVKVSSILSEVDGLEDFKRLRINGSLDNVTFAEDYMPHVDEDLITLLDF